MLLPDDFPGNPYGHVTNQCGHFCIGLGAAAVIYPFWGIAAVAAVGLAYGIIWEWLLQGGKLWRDSLEDTVHVTCGAGVICSALAYDAVIAPLAVWAALTAALGHPRWHAVAAFLCGMLMEFFAAAAALGDAKEILLPAMAIPTGALCFLCAGIGWDHGR